MIKYVKDLIQKSIDVPREKLIIEYVIENKRLEKENRLLGERCNQLLKDKGELTDKIADIKANCDLAIEGRDVKIKELERLNSNQAESLRIIMLEEEKKNKRIEELEKENERLTVSYETLKLHDEEEIGMLKSENAELKHNKKTVVHLADCLEEKMKERIEELETEFNTYKSEATEIIKEAQGYIENNDDELYDKIEQFLKECK